MPAALNAEENYLVGPSPLGLGFRVGTSPLATIVYWGYIGIMEKKMETTIVYWGYVGIMEKKMETTIVY